MKNILKTLTLMSLIWLTGCNDSKTVHLYKDNNSYIDDDLTIRFEQTPQSEFLSGGTLYFEIYFISSNPKPVSLKTKAKNVKIYRELNGAEYSVNTNQLMPYDRIDLQCDIEKSVFLYADLPTLASTEKYYLNFDYNSTKLIYHFYNQPAAQN